MQSFRLVVVNHVHACMAQSFINGGSRSQGLGAGLRDIAGSLGLEREHALKTFLQIFLQLQEVLDSTGVVLVRCLQEMSQFATQLRSACAWTVSNSPRR